MIKQNKKNELTKYLNDKKKLQQHIKELKKNPIQLQAYLKSYNIDNDKIKFLLTKSEVFITHYLYEML